MSTPVSIYIDVKAFVEYDIKQIAQDICDLANRVGVTVCADVNDSFLMALPGDDAGKVISSYKTNLKKIEIAKCAK